MNFNAELRSAAEEVLSENFGEKVRISDITSTAGGCINDAGVLKTSIGEYFIKWNDAAAFPGMFEAEAKGLKILKETYTITIPEVIATGTAAEKYSFILLQYLKNGHRIKNFFEIFGESIAALHKHSHSKFGLDHDNYIGSLPQSNRFHSSWTDFFIEERLEKQIEIARNKCKISTEHIRKFYRLYNKLNEIFPEEPPALLHGDLWSGNFLTAEEGTAAIIDPAVYYGHREAELAFTQLFGGFDAAFYISYNEVFPLEKGFDQRQEIYNLYPLMVHVNLFGGGYLSSVENILKRF